MENENNNEVNEPQMPYSNSEIRIFKSFEEQEEYQLKKMAAQRPDEALRKLEQLRLFFYRHLLLPDGTWPPLKKAITIKKTNIL